jgi:uncharacterized membrane protein (UPF0127 family)
VDYIKVGDKNFPVLLAITSQEQEKGLMHQPWPPPVMAFIYGEPRINSFWMKNTISALDIVFCLKNRVVAIRPGEPNSLKIIGSDVISDLVIEFPFGTCENNGIKEGSDVSLDLETNSKMKILSSKVFRY